MALAKKGPSRRKGLEREKAEECTRIAPKGFEPSLSAQKEKKPQRGKIERLRGELEARAEGWEQQGQGAR